MADKSGRRLLRRRLHRHQHRRHRLADYFGTGEAVAKLTKEAMEGGMKFEEALDARLKLINPTQQGVDKFMAMYAFPTMPGMRELVVKLLTSGKHVFLVSGGFRQIDRACGARRAHPRSAWASPTAPRAPAHST